MLKARPTFKQSYRISIQNSLYLPYITNAKGLLRINSNSISALRNELLTGEHAGIRFSASNDFYQAKIRAKTAKKSVHNIFSMIASLSNAGVKNTGNYKAYAIVVAPKSARLATESTKGNTFNVYRTSNGSHPLKQLNAIRAELNGSIRKELAGQSIKYAGMKVPNYALLTNDEFTITTFKTLLGYLSSEMNQHLHGLLIVPKTTELATLKASINEVVTKYHDEVAVNIQPVNVDYKDVEHPGQVPWLSKSAESTFTLTKPLDDIINYQNKQYSLPHVLQKMHNQHGQRTNMTQGQVLAQLPPRMLVKTIEACVNTLYRVHTSQPYGMLNQQNRLVCMAKVANLIASNKHPQQLIMLNPVEQATLLVSQYLASNESRTKPPP